MSIPINKRLLACAALIREGAVLADVGTDHGYLPIHLLLNGKISYAVLSDINEGPLMRAKENVAEACLGDKTYIVLSDGAAKLSGLGISDYCIAGMGGELIASIIDAAPHIKNSDVRLVLQPMSKPEALRSYLWDNGFSIEREVYVSDEGKHYVCIAAAFSGSRTDYSRADAFFGKAVFFEEISPAQSEYMNERIRTLSRVIEGKKRGGADSSDEEYLLSDLCERLKTTERLNL